MFSCFFVKKKTAYEMRISDWSSDVFSSDLGAGAARARSPRRDPLRRLPERIDRFLQRRDCARAARSGARAAGRRRQRPGGARLTGRALRRLRAAAYAEDAPHLPAVVRDRKTVVTGKSVSVRVGLGGRRNIKKKNK